MPDKKPPAPAPTRIKTTTKPATRRTEAGSVPNPRLQMANRWQRSKRYSWDNR